VHKQECARFAASVAKGESVSVMRPNWRRREIVVLFTDVTSVPFDDLDLMDKHNIPPFIERVQNEEEENEDENANGNRHTSATYNKWFVVPFVTISGAGYAPAVVRPTLAEVRWIEATAKVLMEIGSPPTHISGPIHLAHEKCTVSLADDFTQLPLSNRVAP